MEDAVLKMLSETDGYISGEQISQQLGITRAAVWKRINKLRDEGYAIESVTNRGYHLASGSRGQVYGWDLESAVQALPGGFWKRVVFKETLDSTNLEAKRYLADHADSEGTVVVCERQTAGRGRRGRSWESPAGSGVWMSLILQPEISPAKAPMLTLLTGMAVRRALAECFSMEASIKWPNDIIVDGKKICGILTEMTMEDMHMSGVVVGIGVNMGIDAFPEALQEVATSVSLVTGQEKPDRVELLIRILRLFEQYYDIFMRTQDLSGLLEEYNTHCINVGRTICVLEKSSDCIAKALGIREDGELMIETEDGARRAVSSGEVSIRGVMGYAR